MEWIWFAAIFAGLLGVSLGRSHKFVQAGPAMRRDLAPRALEWDQRTLDVIVDGTGDVPVAMALEHNNGFTRAFRLIASDGRQIEVPAGLVLEIGLSLRPRNGMYCVPAQHPYSIYISSLVPCEGPLRTATQIAPGARLILHDRGWNPAREVAATFDSRWRKRRVTALLGSAAGIVALIASNSWWTWLGVAGCLALLLDAIVLKSLLVHQYCTRSADSPATPPPR